MKQMLVVCLVEPMTLQQLQLSLETLYLDITHIHRLEKVHSF